MRHSIQVLFVLGFCYASCCFAQLLVQQETSGNFVHKRCVINRVLREADLMRLYREESATTRRSGNLHLECWREGEGERVMRLKGVPASAHDGTIPKNLLTGVVARAPLSVGEIVSLAGNTILRIRQPNGSIRRRILQGKDPLASLAPDLPLQIGYLGYEYISGPEAQALQRPTLRLLVFVEGSDNVNLTTAQQTFAKLQSFLPPYTALVARKDGLYLSWKEFPVLNPYSESPLPTLAPEGYRRADTFVCASVKAKIDCIVRSEQ